MIFCYHYNRRLIGCITSISLCCLLQIYNPSPIELVRKLHFRVPENILATIWEFHNYRDLTHPRTSYEFQRSAVSGICCTLQNLKVCSLDNFILAMLPCISFKIHKVKDKMSNSHYYLNMINGHYHLSTTLIYV